MRLARSTLRYLGYVTEACERSTRVPRRMIGWAVGKVAKAEFQVLSGAALHRIAGSPDVRMIVLPYCRFVPVSAAKFAILILAHRSASAR